MKTFKTIILITGILVAGLAFNTAFAQAVESEVKVKPEKEMKVRVKEAKVNNKETKVQVKECKSHHKAVKVHTKVRPKHKAKAHKEKSRKESVL
jgi:hypothetical protein